MGHHLLAPGFKTKSSFKNVLLNEFRIIINNKYMMGYWNGYGCDCGGFPFFSFIFWVALIAFVIMLVGRRRGFGPGHWAGYDRSIDILKERYAKGEINKEEFEARKKDLMG